MDRARFAGALVGAAVGEAIGARWEGLSPDALARLAPDRLLPGRGELFDAWQDPATLALAVQRRPWLSGGPGLAGWFAAVLAGDVDSLPPDDAPALRAAHEVLTTGGGPSDLGWRAGWMGGVPDTFEDAAAAAVVCARRHPNNLMAAVDAAVRLGGATTRTAGLTGALVGASRGVAFVLRDRDGAVGGASVEAWLRNALVGGTRWGWGDGSPLFTANAVCGALESAVAVARGVVVVASIGLAVVPLLVMCALMADGFVRSGCRTPPELTMGEVRKRVELYLLKKPGVPPSLAEVYGDQEVPRDSWGNDFALVLYGPDGTDYDVVSFGADGQPGGSGNDEDIWLSDRW